VRASGVTSRVTSFAPVGARLWEAEAVDLDPVELALVPASPDALLAELHREHYRTLVGLARLVVDTPAEAEEVVQEAFVRLCASWRGLREPDRALAYLRSSVLNLGRSRIRRRVVARRYLSAQRSVDTVPGADEQADTGVVERAAVLAAVRSLPRRQQECVLLRYYERLSEHEIAAALGISEGSVKTHTHRAMAALAGKLEALR